MEVTMKNKLLIGSASTAGIATLIGAISTLLPRESVETIFRSTAFVGYLYLFAAILAVLMVLTPKENK